MWELDSRNPCVTTSFLHEWLRLKIHAMKVVTKFGDGNSDGDDSDNDTDNKNCQWHLIP